MVAIRQQGQMDGDIFGKSMKEVQGAFEEPITIFRWTGTTPGDQIKGIADQDTYIQIRATGVIGQLKAQDIFSSGGIYIPGDLQAELTIPVYGAEAQEGDWLEPGRKPDRVMYRNRAYYFVGHVDRKKLTQRVFWVGVMRQDGS